MIRDAFQLPGTVPLEIDRLQRSVTSGAVIKAVLLSIKSEMPSGPVALVVSKLERSNSMPLGHSSGETVIVSPTVRGATEVLTFLPKDLIRRSTFVWGLDAITPSVCRVGGYWLFSGQGTL